MYIPRPTVALAWLLWCGVFSSPLVADDDVLPTAVTGLMEQFCFDCHGNQDPEAQLSLEKMAARPAFAKRFREWRKVVGMLESKRMPPTDATQPSDAQRRQLISAIRGALRTAAQRQAGDPGDVVMRRLTNAEYAYTIPDLTGLDLKLEGELVGDAVGGEGFTNVGNVQFVQDSTLERYLTAAKKIASHAVIGAGPLGFYRDPGKTGFELSAITRIQQIYRQHGFRTAAGEGGKAFGLDRYPRAFYTAWRYKHRAKLGLPNATLATLAAEEKLDVRFVEYVWSVPTKGPRSFPTSEIVTRWRQLPVPRQRDARGNKDRDLADIRKRCDAVYQLLYEWQRNLGQNPDDKEEASVLAADSFEVAPTKSFLLNVQWPDDADVDRVEVYLSVEVIRHDGRQRPTVIWHDPAVQFRRKDLRRRRPRPLSEVVTPADARQFSFGKHPGGVTVDRQDFVTTGAVRRRFELRVPDDATSARLTVETRLDLEHGDDCVVRCTLSQTKDAVPGEAVSGLLANPEGAAFKAWVPGVIEFARTLPQVSHREPAPSDRDPIPPPFDNTYNNPERNHFHYKIKYHRDDRFLVEHIVDDATRQRLDHAWADLLSSFEYHDAYLRFVAKKYKLDLGDRRVSKLTPSWIESLPAEPRRFVQSLHREYHAARGALEAAQPRHVEDVIRFAGLAWRRPTTKREQNSLRSYYRDLRQDSKLQHRPAIRTLLARVLMAPQFLYRAERPTAGDPVVPLSNWELASRLSYFLWSSLPDGELRRAAAAGELNDAEQLARQADRMLRHPKARRLATEFFGQWFGFYRFDRYRGVDPERFPEFTDSLQAAMYDEAVAFFEHIVRQDRPVREILFADYAFLNRELAEHYGIKRDVAADSFKRVENVKPSHRGGLFGLGAVLTVTSAPRRTSPVKRGDWVLRRVLGTPVPPPPADAGSLPADDVLADGLTIRQRLEAHRQKASCRNCHTRIDPPGFSLENYDAIGRWRDRYRDEQPIDASGELLDGTVIFGPEGLRSYLAGRQELFQRTLCVKLLGYALGRRETLADAMLIEQMMTDLKGPGRFSSLVKRIVTSRQFRHQRSERAGSNRSTGKERE